MNQPAAKTDLKAEMPKTADMVKRRRADWGVAYVNDCMKRGMAGEANCFYASEAGRSIGTPFTGPIGADVAWYLVTHGVDALCFFKTPEVSNGSN